MNPRNETTKNEMVFENTLINENVGSTCASNVKYITVVRERNREQDKVYLTLITETTYDDDNPPHGQSYTTDNLKHMEILIYYLSGRISAQTAKEQLCDFKSREGFWIDGHLNDLAEQTSVGLFLVHTTLYSLEKGLVRYITEEIEQKLCEELNIGIYRPFNQKEWDILVNAIETGFSQRNPHLLLLGFGKQTANKLNTPMMICPKSKNHEDYVYNNEETNLLLKDYIQNYLSYRLPGRVDFTFNTDMRNNELITDARIRTFMPPSLSGTGIVDTISEVKFRLESIRGSKLPAEFTKTNFLFPVSAEGAGQAYEKLTFSTPTIFGLMLLAHHQQENNTYTLPAFYCANTDEFFNLLPMLNDGPNVEIFFGFIGEGGKPKTDADAGPKGRWSGHRFGLLYKREEEKDYFLILDSFADINADCTFMQETKEQIIKILPDAIVTMSDIHLQYSSTGCTTFTAKTYGYCAQRMPNAYNTLVSNGKVNLPMPFISLWQSDTSRQTYIAMHPGIVNEVFPKRPHKTLQQNILNYNKDVMSRDGKVKHQNTKIDKWSIKYDELIEKMLHENSPETIRRMCDAHNATLLTPERLKAIADNQNVVTQPTTGQRSLNSAFIGFK